MKKHEIIFSLIKLPIDFLLIFGVFYVSRDLRLVADFAPFLNLEIQKINNQDLEFFALYWAILYVLIFWIKGLYFNTLSTSKIKEYLEVAKYSVYWFILFSFFVYFWNDFLYEKDIPRLIIIYTTIIWIFFVIFLRFLVNILQWFWLSRWALEKRNLLLLVNDDYSDVSYILDDIHSAKIYKLIWYINFHKKDLPIEYVWDLSDWKDAVRFWWIDEILYVSSSYSDKELNSLIELSKIYWVRYRYVTNSFDITKNNTEVSLLNKLILVEIKNTSLDYMSKILKRLIDFCISLFSLIILSPLFLIIGILIKLEDPTWPILYKNKRVWQKWKEFNLYKFRYMKWEYCIKDSYWVSSEDDEALAFEQELIEESSRRDGPLYKIENDPRKTKIWTFIEKYSIDELPQFFNVLLWDMSIVWPRPHQPREVSKYSETQKRVLSIKPWITWMAQVNGRELNSFDREVRLDIFYIENWSFLLDLKIFFKTFVVTFFRK